MLPLLSAIPDPIKQQIADTMIDFLAKQADKFASEKIGNSLRRLSSNGDFQREIDKALHKGAERFAAEYTQQDEDLAEVIRTLPDFWKAKSVQRELVALIKQPGAWLVEEREKVVAHFEEVLPQRLNRERVDRAVSYFLRCVVEELWTMPGAKEIRDVYIMQFQKITAQAVREQASLARQQLQATTQLSADLRDALSQITISLEKNLLAAPAVTALPAPRPYHNLPHPDYSRFVGREKELAWLRQRLLPQDRAWLITLTGIGGVGKSALALFIAHAYLQDYNRLPPEERFDAIIWISAKEEVLTAQGREKAVLSKQVLRSLEDAYTVIAQVLDREDITRATAEEQSHLVEKALKTQRTLLIMDNLESVKDERLKPFLRNLPMPTKALITSREWLDVADVLALTGLDQEEADQLVAEEVSLRQVTLETDQRRRLFDLTSGLPLPIRLSAARLAGGESFEAIMRWLGDASGDLAEYCIAGQATLTRSRDPNAWQLLLGCALFDQGAGASRDALGYIADLSLADRDKGLAQLQRLFLINHTGQDRFWMLPIVQRYASDQFNQESTRPQLIERWLGWLTKFVEEKGGDFRVRIETIHEFGQEYPNVLGALRWCRKNELWERVFQFAVGTWYYNFVTNLFHDLEEIIQAAQESSAASGDSSQLGQVKHQIGLLAYLRGDYQKALEATSVVEGIARQHGDLVLLSEAIDIKGSVMECLGKLDEAEAAGHELFELSKKTGEPLHTLFAVYFLSTMALVHNNPALATHWTDIAEESVRRLGSARCINGIQYLRASILIAEEKYLEAEPFLLDCIKGNLDWGEVRYVADNQRYLAEVYARTNRLFLAHQIAQDALAVFQRLGLASEVKKTEQLIASL